MKADREAGVSMREHWIAAPVLVAIFHQMWRHCEKGYTRLTCLLLSHLFLENACDCKQGVKLPAMYSSEAGTKQRLDSHGRTTIVRETNCVSSLTQAQDGHFKVMLFVPAEVGRTYCKQNDRRPSTANESSANNIKTVLVCGQHAISMGEDS